MNSQDKSFDLVEQKNLLVAQPQIISIEEVSFLPAESILDLEILNTDFALLDLSSHWIEKTADSYESTIQLGERSQENNDTRDETTLTLPVQPSDSQSEIGTYIPVHLNSICTANVNLPDNYFVSSTFPGH